MGSERRYGLVGDLFIWEHLTVANLASNILDTKLLHHDGKREFVLTGSNRLRPPGSAAWGNVTESHTRDSSSSHGHPHSWPTPSLKETYADILADSDPEKIVIVSALASRGGINTMRSEPFTHVSPAVNVMETHSRAFSKPGQDRVGVYP